MLHSCRLKIARYQLYTCLTDLRINGKINCNVCTGLYQFIPVLIIYKHLILLIRASEAPECENLVDKISCNKILRGQTCGLE